MADWVCAFRRTDFDWIPLSFIEAPAALPIDLLKIDRSSVKGTDVARL